MLLSVTFIYCTSRGGVSKQWPLNNKMQGPNVVKHEVFQGTWFPKSRWWPICSFKGHSLTLRGLQHFGGTCLSCSRVLPHPHHQNPTGFHPFVNGCLSMNLNYLTSRSLPYISNCTTSPTFIAISSKVANTMFWSDLLFATPTLHQMFREALCRGNARRVSAAPHQHVIVTEVRKQHLFFYFWCKTSLCH